MFNVKAEPVANDGPYKRIAINSDPEPGDPNIVPLTTAEICENLMKQHEANRIWALVQESASGVNPPTSSSSSTSSHTDCDDTVCTDGWEAG